MLINTLSACFMYYKYVNQTATATSVQVQYSGAGCEIALGQFVFAQLSDAVLPSGAAQPEAFAQFGGSSLVLDFNCYEFCTFQKGVLRLQTASLALEIWHISTFLGVVLGSVFGAALLAAVAVLLACRLRRRK